MRRWRASVGVVSALVAAALALTFAPASDAAGPWVGSVSLGASPTVTDANARDFTLTVSWSATLGGYAYLSIWDDHGTRYLCRSSGVGSQNLTLQVPYNATYRFTAYVQSGGCPTAPPTSPWAVSNQVDVTNLGYTGAVDLTPHAAITDVNNSSTPLTATLSKPLPSGYTLQVFGSDGWRPLCTTTAGTTSRTVSVTAPVNTSITYTAYVSQGGCTNQVPTNDVKTTSISTVTNQGYIGAVSLTTATARTDANSTTATLTGTLSLPLLSPYTLTVFDDLGSRKLCRSSTGSPTTATVDVAPANNTTRTYTAYVAQGGCVTSPPTVDVKTTSSVAVSNVGYIGSVSLSGDTSLTSVTNRGASLTATLSKPLPAPYNLQLLDDLGNIVMCSSTVGLTQQTEGVAPDANVTRTYTAYISQSPCNGQVPTVDVRSTSTWQVTNQGYIGHATISADHNAVDFVTPEATITATVDQRVATPYEWGIYRDDDLIQICSNNFTTCTAHSSPGPGVSENLSVQVAQALPSHVLPGGNASDDLRASDYTFVVGRSWNGSIALSPDRTQLDAANPAALVNVSASQQLPTGYEVRVFDGAGVLQTVCSAASLAAPGCQYSVSLPNPATVLHTAYLVPQGTNVGFAAASIAESATAMITSLPSGKSVAGASTEAAAAAMLARFGSKEEACAAMAQVEPSNAVYHASAPDIMIVCGQASTLAQVLELMASGALGVAATAAVIDHVLSGSQPTVDPAAPTAPSGNPWSASSGEVAGITEPLVAAVTTAIIERRDNTTYTPSAYVMTDAEAKQVARACIEQARAGQFSERECEKTTIFVPGDSSFDAAMNDLYAIIHGRVARLHYVNSQSQGLPEGWYNGISRLTGIPYRQGTGCEGIQGTGVDCDEYPFRSTSEAGPMGPGQPFNPAGAYLNSANRRQNRDEGRRLLSMYTTCAMLSGVSGDTRELTPSGPSSFGDAFLVVPMPTLVPQTTFICKA